MRSIILEILFARTAVRNGWLFFLAALIFIVIGCDRPSSDSGSSKEDACAVQTDASRFDAADYYGINERSKITYSDALAAYQWHLYNFGQKAGTTVAALKKGEDLNVTPVWNDLGVTGKGVVIAIVDTGVDVFHPDLNVSYVEPLSWNYYQTGQSNPSPVAYNGTCFHGTATAGIAAARGFNGGIGVMGVAPEAYYAGLNVGLGCGFSAGETEFADALSTYSDNRGGELAIDIFSNSWGCTTANVACVSTLELDAVSEGVLSGRAGKGAIYLFAAGNNRSAGANGNYFAEQNGFETISVAALGSDGVYASYSNPGANILISGYGGDNPRIVTTDIPGCDRGLSAVSPMQHKLNWNGEYTHLMDGTSAATPMVAGVAALMLEANPDLTWRDVRYILATTARKNDPDDGNWSQNGAGHWINDNYGFGVADAFSAVKKAQTFGALGALQSVEYAGGVVNETVSDWSHVERYIGVPDNAVDKIEFVDVWIDINASAPRRLDIRLIAPSGAESVLARSDFELPTGFYDGGYRFGTVRHLDEESNGTWRLVIENGPVNQPAEFRGWKIRFQGRSQ